MSLADALLSPSHDHHAHLLQPTSHDDDDLFGEHADLNVVKHEDPTTPASSEHVDHMDRIASPDRKHREAMEYREEDEPAVEHVLEANAAIPNIPVPTSSDGNYWVIRMPTFVKVDSKPFHADTYVGPEQEDDDAQQAESLREKSMTIKLKVENTVRWRWQKDQNGQDRRQSNSRIVRWSDGSLSLQLGKELFDITQTIDTSGAVARQAIGPSQSSQNTLSTSQPPSTPAAPTKSQGLTYLVAQHKRAEILQCEALVTGYMSLRPTGMQSETHRMLVRAVGQKHNKIARLRMAPDPTVDPEREKMEMLKLASRKPKKARGEDDGLGGSRRRRASYSRRRTDDMWSDDDDDDEPADAAGDEDDEFGRAHRGSKAKRKKSAKDESKKGPGEYQTDDFLVADSEDEDGAFSGSDGASRRKRTRRKEAEDEEPGEDDLDAMEARIDRQTAEDRKRRKEVGGRDAHDDAQDDGQGEDGMDIESEEEDDDFGVRRTRTAPGARKKRAIGLDDDDDDEE